MAAKFNIKGLKYPQPDKIGTRSSTIARSMASTMMPRVEVSDSEVNKWMSSLFGDTRLNELTCVYCGKKASCLDHLFPLIKDKKPSGYCTEPANLVPCCNDCNGSKGSKMWWDYMNIDLYDKNNKYQKKIINRLKKVQNGKGLDDRKSKLRDFCLNNELPYQNEKGEIVMPNKNEHIVRFFENVQINKWWNYIYSNVINALDTAQIKIDAFNAGVEKRLKDNPKNIETIDCYFRDYFASCIEKEMEDRNPLLKEVSKAYVAVEKASFKVKEASEKVREITNKSTKKAKEAANKADKANQALFNAQEQLRIVQNVAQKTESELKENKDKKEGTEQDKNYTLLDMGFYCVRNGNSIIITKNGNEKGLQNDPMYKAAKAAFRKGYNYVEKASKAEDKSEYELLKKLYVD